MRVLLDTNILIHREASTVVNEDIGVLFKWLDNLHYTKYIHQITVEEIEKHQNPEVRKTFNAKLQNYNLLKTKAPIAEKIRDIIQPIDKEQNDVNDTLIINELLNGRVDILITEDKKLHYKASLLGISEKVYTIDAFLEKVNIENPELADYKVLSVRRCLFGDLDLSDNFFDSFKEDYPEYKEWFNKKAEEIVYVCLSDSKPIALLYLKVEDKYEDYSELSKPFLPKKRLKIGSFKVTLNGFRIGERFLKIIFDNAIRLKVEEVYVTIFNKRIEQQRLINLLEEYGFSQYCIKKRSGVNELVYVRSCEKIANRKNPKLTYPFFSTRGQIFIVPIYPQYHTDLFPDSILKTESPMNFIENEPHRNAISKVFVSRMIERNLNTGDIILFYRSGSGEQPAYYSSVITTIGIIEKIIDHIPSEEEFIRLCRKRSVFTDKELSEQWNYNPKSRPFIVNFLYVYSLPKRINRQKLLELSIFTNVYKGPRGFTNISQEHLYDIIRESQTDESIVVD